MEYLKIDYQFQQMNIQLYLKFQNFYFLSFVANGTKFSNGTDIYVAKFNSLGTNLLASTYLGGSQNDGVNNNINT